MLRLLFLLGLLPCVASLTPAALRSFGCPGHIRSDSGRGCRRPRPHFGRSTKRRSVDDESESSSTVAVLENNEERGQQLHVHEHHARAPPRMVPLSKPPLLLLQSSAPIISKESCSLLSQYFDQLKNNGADTYERQLDQVQMNMAEALLSDIHDVVDMVTNCPRHDGEMKMPRYVRYDSTMMDTNELFDPKTFGNAVLPDGLHVDTNNGKLFRHVTAILYLTNNCDGFSMNVESYRSNEPMEEYVFGAGGGTVFPLAVPMNENQIDEHNNLVDVAKRLLARGIQHTKADNSVNVTSYGCILEKSALDVFHWDNSKDLSILSGQFNYQFSSSSKPNNGVRVMPEAGKLIYFHNVGDDGMPEPLSFHGGEELIAILPDGHLENSYASRVAAMTKSILVFFKEIPMRTFQDVGIKGFAVESEKSRSWTKKTYY